MLTARQTPCSPVASGTSGLMGDDLDPHTPYAAWEVTLDRLELDVMRVERGLANNSVVACDPWDVPADYGPIPQGLQERAQQLLARQRDCMTTMAEVLTAVGRQQAVVDAVGQATSTHGITPVYVERYI